MAESDLIARKILATDPQVGFGESAVLPYRRSPLDTRGLEAMERAQTRRAVAENELKQSNEAFYNQRLNKLEEYDHVFNTQMDAMRKNLVGIATKTIRSGNRLAADSEFNQAFTAYQALAQGTMQLKKQSEDIEKLTDADVGKYIDLRELKAESAKMKGGIALAVNDGDVSAIQGTVMPNLNDPKFFKADEFIYDKTKDIKASIESNESLRNSGLGQYIIQTEKGYKFATRDEKGNLIPGVDKSVLDYFLTVPSSDRDTLQFREVIGSLADSQIENKALQILQNDPRYKGLTEDQVPEALKRLKQQIAFDQNSEHFEGRDAVMRNIVRAKLDPFQESTEKSGMKTGYKYDKDNGSGEGDVDSPEGLFIKTLAGLQQQTPEIIGGLGESTVTNENNVPYLDATSLFKGINTGQDKEGKAHEPYAVLIDPEKPGSIYIQQTKNSELIPMSDAAITEFAVSVGNIKGNNLSYKTMVKEGSRLGVFGKNNQFIGKNAATKDPEFSKEQEDLAKDVSGEATNRIDKLKTAISEDKKSWITDWSREDVNKVQNDINENVLKGTTLIDKSGIAYKNPKVEIERGLLGGVTYVVTGADDKQIKLTEEEFSAIANGSSGKLVVSRQTVKGKNKPTDKPKTVVQNGITYTYNEQTGEYE